MIEDTIIKLESVSMVYEAERRPTIQVIDITIKRNELVYVVDPNASGNAQPKDDNVVDAEFDEGSDTKK